jgi:hypothetical protein
MIDKKTVKKMMYDILRHKAGLSDHKIMHPVREWFLGMFVSLLLLTTSVFSSLYIYRLFNHDHGSGDVVENIIPTVVYKEREIKEAIKNIETRQKEYAELKENLVISNTIILPRESLPEKTPPVVEDEVLDVSGTNSESEATSDTPTLPAISI